MTLRSSTHLLTVLRTEFGFHWLSKMVNFCVTLLGHPVTLVKQCPDESVSVFLGEMNMASGN